MRTTVRKYFTENKSMWMFVIVVFIVFSVLNWLTPMVRDEYVYQFFIIKGCGDITHPIHTFWEVILAQIDHFFYHYGRIWAEIIYQSILCLAGKWLFNVLNPFLFCIYLFLIIKYALGRVSLSSMVVTVSLVFIFMAVFQDFFLWMAGAVNYLWTSVLVLWFLLVLRRHKDKSISRSSWPLLLLGVMAGWTHEGITIPLSVGLLAAAFIFKSANRRSESLWMKVAFFAGAFVCMLFSLQQEQYLKNGSLADKFIFKWMIGMQVMQELYLVYLFVILFLILAVIRKIHVHQFVCDNFPLLVAMMITLFIVFYSGIAGNVRPAYSLEFCSLILILRMLSGFHLEKRPKRILTSLLMLILAAYTIPVCYYSYVNYQEHCDIESQIKKGEQLVVLDSREMPRWIEKNVCRTVNFFTGHPYYFDPDGDMCCYIAAYYGVDHVSFCPRQVLDMMNSHPESFDSFTDCGGLPIYAFRLSDRKEVYNVSYMLDEQADSMPFYKRWFPSWVWGYDAHRFHPFFQQVMFEDADYLFIKKIPQLEDRATGFEIETE